MTETLTDAELAQLLMACVSGEYRTEVEANERLRAWASSNAAALARGVLLARRAAPAADDLRAAVERHAVIAECAFDDRPRDRCGHHSHMDWEDGFRDGTRAAAAAIRDAQEAGQ